MFLIDVEYTVLLDKVDAALADHVVFLKENYAKGIFLISGRKVPRTGGVILARGIGRAELEAILATDPFAKQGLATYQVTEFVALMTAPELAWLKEA